VHYILYGALIIFDALVLALTNGGHVYVPSLTWFGAENTHAGMAPCHLKHELVNGLDLLASQAHF
jgi:hypothetical protein